MSSGIAKNGLNLFMQGDCLSVIVGNRTRYNFMLIPYHNRLFSQSPSSLTTAARVNGVNYKTTITRYWPATTRMIREKPLLWSIQRYKDDQHYNWLVSTGKQVTRPKTTFSQQENPV